MLCHNFCFDGAPTVSRKSVVVNTNYKKALFCRDTFAIRQLEDEFALCYFLTYRFHSDAGFLK